jgi:hypothetical protein
MCGCVSCLRRRASPPTTASMTKPNPCARTRCGARPSRCVMPSISPCHRLCRVSSPSNVRLAGRNAPHPTPGETRRWTMRRCGMGGPSRGTSGFVVQSPRPLPRVYYTPSAAAHLDYCVPQRTSGGHAGQYTSRSKHERCKDAYPAHRTYWSLKRGTTNIIAPLAHRAYRHLESDAASVVLQRRQTCRRVRALRPGTSATDRDTGAPWLETGRPRRLQ